MHAIRYFTYAISRTHMLLKSTKAVSHCVIYSYSKLVLVSFPWAVRWCVLVCRDKRFHTGCVTNDSGKMLKFMKHQQKLSPERIQKQKELFSYSKVGKTFSNMEIFRVPHKFCSLGAAPCRYHISWRAPLSASVSVLRGLIYVTFLVVIYTVICTV